MIKALLWDIDGTILDFKKSESHGVKKCFEIFGLGECTDEMVARYSAINDKYWKKLELGEITKPQVLYMRYREFLDGEGIPFDRIDELNLEYQHQLGEHYFETENAFSLMKLLKNEYKQYAVTNGNSKVQRTKLKLAGLNEIFDGIFISDEIGNQKPSPEFFNAVFNEIPEARDESIIIGDSLTSDMRGGNNAGILCCWYNPNGEINDKDVKVDFEIQKLDDIKTVLRNV